MRKTHRLVLLADEALSITSMLADLYGIDTAEVEGYRTQCPYGYEHSDGGHRPALRLFPSSNSAWCFSCSKKITPATLARDYFDLPPVAASIKALELYEISTTPPTLEERWATANAKTQYEVDVDILRQAFTLFLATLPNYSQHQYHPVVLEKVHKILGILNKLPEGTQYSTLNKWMEKSKLLMRDLWEKEGFAEPSHV